MPRPEYPPYSGGDTRFRDLVRRLADALEFHLPRYVVDREHRDLVDEARKVLEEPAA